MAESEDPGGAESGSEQLSATTETIANELATGATIGITQTLAAAGMGPKLGPALPLNDGPPEVIGKYRIERQLGAGGMGVVYLGRDLDLDRPVAIKLLRADVTRGQSLGRAHARMRREARAMARLGHPHVVRVYEVGTASAQLFVAMEYVEGQTLDAWIRADERSWADIAAVFAQAGEGLLAAHDVGIVHRDFKPHNVLVEADTGASQLVAFRARVLDFGLAGLGGPEVEVEDELDLAGPGAASESGPGLAETLARLTMTGSLLGTPAYMAPEQFIGASVDPRADQFAFCVALYEALYGQRPFPGQTLAELREAVLAGDLRSPPVASEVPAWLHDLVVRGLAPEPDARWPSMRELLVALTTELDSAIAEELNHSIGRETRERLFKLLAVTILAVALPAFLVIGRDSPDLKLITAIGSSCLVAISVLIYVFRRTLLSSPYNRRAVGLLFATVAGSLANVLISFDAGLPMGFVDRYNLVLLGCLGLLASLSFDSAMAAVAILAVVGSLLAHFVAPMFGGLSFVTGVALICLLIGLGSSRRRRSSAMFSVSLRGSAAERRTGGA